MKNVYYEDLPAIGSFKLANYFFGYHKCRLTPEQKIKFIASCLAFDRSAILQSFFMHKFAKGIAGILKQNPTVLINWNPKFDDVLFPYCGKKIDIATLAALRGNLFFLRWCNQAKIWMQKSSLLNAAKQGNKEAKIKVWVTQYVKS